MILKAILTMPNVGSWNGKWENGGKEYSIKVKINKGDIPIDTYNMLKDGKIISGYYNFGDGWCANVSIKLKGKEKTTGLFSSYAWMIKPLLLDGEIHTNYKNSKYNKIRS